jgi:hypothetical protein
MRCAIRGGEPLSNILKNGGEHKAKLLHARIHEAGFKAGIARVGRYTGDWARRDSKWRYISAHTSRKDF